MLRRDGMLEISHVSFQINNCEILKDISLHCGEGEILTIVGPNGCGKSTLLKTVSRIYRPTAGKVELFGREIGSYPTRELARLMAILPQKKSAASDMTVEQLVGYGRSPHTGFGGRMAARDFRAVDEAIEATGIGHLRKRTMANLSGGESQMAWIAMCVAQEPKLLLLDEPTTFLDIAYQLEVLELIKRLNEQSKITIIMVLHDINQAARYSDRIYMMEKGKGYRFGRPGEVLQEEAFGEVFRVQMSRLYGEGRETPYFQPERTIKSDGR